MRAVGGHRGFGRHAGVADRMAAGHAVEAETLRDLVGPPDLLEDGHAPAAADDGQFRHGGDLRPYGGFIRGPDGEDEVGVVHDMRERRAARFEAAHEGGEIAIARTADGQLDRTGRCGAVDGKAR